MAPYRVSYRKSMLLATVALAALLLITGVLCVWLAPLRQSIAIIAFLAALPLLLTVVSGFVVLHRDSLLATGSRDYFLASGESRSEASVATGRIDIGLQARRMIRSIFAPRRLLVGDKVKVKSLEKILATLDVSGRVNGLPFMPEMARFCGRDAVVFRRVDKIYDYGGKKNLRRLRGVVLLQGMRCDGAAHGGCQAACYALWKEDWLESDNKIAISSAPEIIAPEALVVLASGASEADRYVCQFTSLVAATVPLKSWDPRGDLRPLLSGNVTLGGWSAVLLTRWFNRVQAIRGGVPYPVLPAVTRAEPSAPLNLLPGVTVTVRSPADIATTLDKNSKNRGLWFDSDMLKHSGRRYTVSRRVDRIIDDATGLMRTIKTPCIVLSGVNYSGEGLRFCAQEENLYWREAWLTPEGHADVAPKVAR